MMPILLGLLFLSNTTIIGHLNQTMVEMSVGEQKTVKVYLESGLKDLYNVTINYTSDDGVQLLNNYVNVNTMAAGSKTREYEIWIVGKKPGIWNVRYTAIAKYKEDLNENRTSYWEDIKVKVIEKGKLVEKINWPMQTMLVNSTQNFTIEIENVGEVEERLLSMRVNVSGAELKYLDEKNNTITISKTIKPGKKHIFNFTLLATATGQVEIQVIFGADAAQLNDKLYFISVIEPFQPTVIATPSPTVNVAPTLLPTEIPKPTVINYNVLPEKDYSSLIFAYATIFVLAGLVGATMYKFAKD